MNQFLLNSKRTRTIAVIMVLILLLTIVPVLPNQAQASGSLTIDTPVNNSQSNPIVVNSNSYRLTGSFVGFPISSISYTVTNMGTNQASSGGSPYNPPGTSVYVYENIVLTPGLNRVTVRSSVGTSLVETIYVEYNDMPGIFNIHINSELLESDEIVINPSMTQGQTSVSVPVSGLATNASQVIITNESLVATNPNATVAAQIFGSSGTFNTMILVEAGENVISFRATNETKSVTETRRVIVNILTAGAGIDVYNVQSGFKSANPNVLLKNVPKNKEVDFKATPSNNSLSAKGFTDLVDDDIAFKGKLIVNPGGAGFLPLNEFRTATNGERVYSDLEVGMEVWENGVWAPITPEGDKKSILTTPAVTTPVAQNPALIINADSKLYSLVTGLNEINPLVTAAVTNINTAIDMASGITVTNTDITAAQLGQLQAAYDSAMAIAPSAVELNTKLTDANAALTAIGQANFPVTNLSTAGITTPSGTYNTDVLGHITLTPPKSWDALITDSPAISSMNDIVTSLTAIKTAVESFETQKNTIGTQATGTLSNRINTVATLMRGNAAISIDGGLSGTMYFYDFRTQAFDEGIFDEGKTYRLVLQPKFYAATATPIQGSYMASFIDPYYYTFTYVNLSSPRIEGLQNGDTGEVIYNVLPPNTNFYRIAQKPFNLKINFKNFNVGDMIVVKHESIPYTGVFDEIIESIQIDAATIKVEQEAVGIDSAGRKNRVYLDRKDSGIIDGYIIIPLPNLVAGNNRIVVEKETTPTIMMQRDVLVTTTPMVRVMDKKNQTLANNKVYEFIYDNTKPSETVRTFLESLFNPINIKFDNVSGTNPLGGTNNPIFIKLNGRSLPGVEAGILTNSVTTPTNIMTAPVIQNGVISSLNLNLSNWEYHDINTQIFNQGLNTLTIEFFNGNTPVKVDITFYLFTVLRPEVSNIFVFDNKYPGGLEIKDFEAHYTDANTISLQGNIKNADRVILRVQGQDKVDLTLANGSWINTVNTQGNTMGTGFTMQGPSNDQTTFRINNYELKNPSEEILQSTFTFSLEISQGSTTIIRPITVVKKVEPYSVLMPYRTVVNNNMQKIAIRADNAENVLIGGKQAEKVTLTNTDLFTQYVKDWLDVSFYGSERRPIYDGISSGYVFFAEVPLKTGANKINITINFGSQTITGVMDLHYVASPQVGAVFKADLSRTNRIKPKELGDKIEINFPKGTVLQKKNMQIQGQFSDPYSFMNIPNFFIDKGILIGIADPDTGKIDRDINRPTNANLSLGLNQSYYNQYFIDASDLFYIDAGTVTHPGGRLPYETPLIATRTIENSLEPTRQGTITLQYHQNIVQDASSHLTVMYNPGFTTGTESGWRNLGGVVNSRNNTISVPFEGFGYYSVMKLNRTFGDIIFHPWAKRDLEAMFSKGIMVSEPGVNRFGTDLNITRGEFTQMLVKALNIPVNDGPYVQQGFMYRPVNNSFDDTMPGMGDFFWKYKYVETAARAGIIQGIAPGLFMPNEQLTREQAAVIIARALEARMVRTPELALTQLTKDFTDAAAISHYARQSVAAIARTGVIVGKPNNPNDANMGFSFQPQSNLTRAEAAVIARRLMQQQKLLPDPL